MKKVFLIIITFGLLNQLSAQEIKIFPTYAISSYQNFKSGIGYGIGYNLILKSNNKLGFAFTQRFNNTAYNYTESSLNDGMAYHRNVIPKNQWITFSSTYSWNISKTQKSNLYLGPKIGFNYFKMNEIIVSNRVNETITSTYNSKYSVNNKFGLGLSLEYERKVSDKVSLAFAVEPELIAFYISERVGTSEPAGITNINFNFNVNFNFAKSKIKE